VTRTKDEGESDPQLGRLEDCLRLLRTSGELFVFRKAPARWVRAICLSKRGSELLLDYLEEGRPIQSSPSGFITSVPGPFAAKLRW